MADGGSRRARLFAGLALLGLGAALAFVAVSGRGRGARAAPRFTSSEDCRACHAEVFAEWRASHHAIAFTNPEVRKLSNDFKTKECRDCHLPRPVSETGIGEPPLPRETRPGEGVDCLTCHLGADGRILGRRSLPQAGCRPVASQELVSVALCETCHNQHKTTDQFRASRFAQDPGGCNACHMPPAARAGRRRGRGHVFPGAHDAAMLRRAARFEVAVEGGRAVVTVANEGAGHNFPTEERHRAVDVLYRILPPGAKPARWKPAFTRLYRFRMPYVGEPGEDTQLPAGQVWRGSLPLEEVPPGARVEFRLVYKLQPYLPDEKSVVLFEREVRR